MEMNTFVEIGSCDFDTLNDFALGNWKGVIVEPVAKYLNNLPKRENVTYLNYAVDTKAGKRNLYLMNEAMVDADHDYAGMSTFYERKDASPVEVETITYEQVIEKAGIERVDYLKIDTEGHDWEILQSVIFEGPLRPVRLRVEHKHCPVDEMIDFLEQRYYEVYHLRDDLVCTDKHWLDENIPWASKR